MEKPSARRLNLGRALIRMTGSVGQRGYLVFDLLLL